MRIGHAAPPVRTT